VQAGEGGLEAVDGDRKWALRPEPLMLPAEALMKMRELTEAAPKASPLLRGAAKRQRK
jgi:hypothetical protein